MQNNSTQRKLKIKQRFPEEKREVMVETGKEKIIANVFKVVVSNSKYLLHAVSSLLPTFHASDLHVTTVWLSLRHLFEGPDPSQLKSIHVPPSAR